MGLLRWTSPGRAMLEAPTHRLASAVRHAYARAQQEKVGPGGAISVQEIPVGPAWGPENCGRKLQRAFMMEWVVQWVSVPVIATGRQHQTVVGGAHPCALRTVCHQNPNAPSDVACQSGPCLRGPSGPRSTALSLGRKSNSLCTIQHDPYHIF